jgi:hypothetical protein
VTQKKTTKAATVKAGDRMVWVEGWVVTVTAPNGAVADLSLDGGETTAYFHTLFVETAATGDFTMTKRLREMVDDGANEDDVVAYLTDRNLPVDEIEARNIAREVLKAPPSLGYLTISNALQWRLQYGHAIREAGRASGVVRL